jgi:hypothetical protein
MLPAVSVRETGIVTGLLATGVLFGPVAVTTMLPLYDPAESNVGVTSTVTVPDPVVPLSGVTASQGPPLFVDGVMV